MPYPVGKAVAVRDAYDPSFVETWLYRNYDKAYIDDLEYVEAAVVFYNGYMYDKMNRMIDRAAIIGSYQWKDKKTAKKGMKSILNDYDKKESEFVKNKKQKHVNVKEKQKFVNKMEKFIKNEK